MRPNRKIQELYRAHTEHIPRDTEHVGEAESVQDVLSLMGRVKPNVYMLAKCCVDGEPTLQLATWDVTRRVRLNLLSAAEREKVIKELESRGIEYRRTSYLPLNPDFTETTKCKIQKHFKFVYKIKLKAIQYAYRLHIKVR